MSDKTDKPKAEAEQEMACVAADSAKKHSLSWESVRRPVA